MSYPVRMRFWLVTYRDRHTGETLEDVLPAGSEHLLRLSFNRGRLLTVVECDGWSGEPLR